MDGGQPAAAAGVGAGAGAGPGAGASGNQPKPGAKGAKGAKGGAGQGRDDAGGGPGDGQQERKPKGRNRNKGRSKVTVATPSAGQRGAREEDAARPQGGKLWSAGDSRTREESRGADRKGKEEARRLQTLNDFIRAVGDKRKDLERRLQSAVSLRESIKRPAFAPSVLLLQQSALHSLVAAAADGPRGVRAKQALFAVVAEVIGHIGLAHGVASPVFTSWLEASLQKNAPVQAGSQLATVELTLAAMLEALRVDAGRVLAPNVDKYLHAMCTFFDGVTDEDLLAPILKTYAKLAQDYPAAFQPFFNDLVDIMVGWFVDETNSARSRNVLAAAFGMFAGFAAAGDGQFTAEIVQNLLADLTDTVGTGSAGAHAENLARCLAVIVNASGTAFLSNMNPAGATGAPVSLAADLLGGLVACLPAFAPDGRRESDALGDIARCLVGLCAVLRAGCADHLASIAGYLLSWMGPLAPHRDTLQCLAHLNEAVSAAGTATPELAQVLFAHPHFLNHARTSQHSGVIVAAMQLTRHVLHCSRGDARALQAAYGCLVNSIRELCAGARPAPTCPGRRRRQGRQAAAAAAR